MARLAVNGRVHEVAVLPSARLLDVLREDLQLKGTRFGCGSGECGACHVLVDGRSVPACDTPLEACEGHEVTTAEGLDAKLLSSFFVTQAAQCGYCTSGMLVSVEALLRVNPRPSEDEVKAALDRHLCRCGSHNRVLRAVRMLVELPW